jgi:tetrahydromethanopterin S-methyltransferase subunit G
MGTFSRLSEKMGFGGIFYGAITGVVLWLILIGIIVYFALR